MSRVRRLRHLGRFPAFPLLACLALASTPFLFRAPASPAPARPVAAALGAPAAVAAAPLIGALEGTFSVDGNGAATYQVELEVPPGTGRVQPDLSLTYSSQRDNGLIGMGWALNGVDAISRCNAAPVPDGFVAPVAFNYSDRFCLAGMTLLAVSGEYGRDGTQYRTVRDTWTRVVSHGQCGQGPCWFSAQNKDGAELRFGFTTGTTGSRILASGRSDGAVRVWSLDRYLDNNSNYTAVSYYNDTAAAEYYPVRIDYTGNERTGLAPQRSVVFVYALRADRITAYQGGSPYQILSRLTAIRTYVGTGLVKSYVLGYTYGGATGRSRLRSLQDCSTEAVSADTCLPATVFDLSDPANGFSNGAVVDTGRSPSQLLGMVPMDVNGDGRTDLVQAWNGSGRLNLTTYLSNGSSLGPGTNQDTGVAAGNLGVIGMDVTGNGRGDIVMPAASGGKLEIHAFLSTGGGFGRDIVTRTGQPVDHLAFLAMDVGGDGREDLVQVVNRNGKVGFVVYPANGDGTFGAGIVTETAQRTDNHGFMALDVNGDGRADVVQSQSAGGVLNFIVYYSNGRGFEGGATTSSGRNPAKFQLAAADVNGDHKADLILIDLDRPAVEVTPYLSTGTGFRSARTLSVQGGDSNLGIYAAELNGDGRTDLLQAQKVGSAVRLLPFYSTGDGYTQGAAYDSRLTPDSLGLMAMAIGGNVKQDLLDPQVKSGRVSLSQVTNTPGQPDLLDRLTTGLNGQVAVTHRPMTDPAICKLGTGAQYPVIDLATPVPVVSRYVNSDGRGASYTFDYRYEQARLGFTGIGWLGFGYIRMIQTADGRFSETTYDQTYPSNGLVTKNAVFDARGVILGSTDLRYEDAAPAELRAKGIHQFVRTSETYNSFDDQSGGAKLYTLQKTYAYDAYGNVNLIGDLGRPSVPEDRHYTCLRYDNNAAAWQLGYVAQELQARTLPACQAFLAAGNPAWDAAADLRWEKKEYDSRKNLIASSIWDDSNKVWVRSSATFDDYGNRLTMTDPAGNTTAFELDALYHTFPVKVTSPPDQGGLRLVDTYKYEPAFGVETEDTDPNGNVFRWQVDGFGRVVDEYSPDPSGQTVRTRHVAWGRDAAGCFVQESTRNAWDAADLAAWFWEKTYFDGLQREYRSEARGAAPGRALVNEIRFNADGQVSGTAVPYFTGGTPRWITSTYDVYNRPTSTVLPDGTVQKIEYQLGTLKVYRTDAYGTPEARTEIDQFNGAGMMTSRIFGNGQVYRYTYSPLNQLLGIETLPDRRNAAFTYDSLGRLRSQGSGDTGTTRYSWNGQDQMNGTTDADGNSVTYTHDGLGRIVTATARTAAGSDTTNYTYDGATANGRGNLTRVDLNRPPLGAYSYQMGYDAYRQTRTVRTTLAGQTYSYGMDYNPQGQMTGEDYPDGARLTIAYGADANPATFSLAAAGGAAETYITYSDYNHFGIPLTSSYRNGVEVKRAFYADDVATGKLKTIAARATRGTPRTLFTQEIDWNRLDFVTALKDPGAPGRNQAYGYDAAKLGFLSNAVGPYGSETYTYDKVGNRTARNGVSSTYPPASDRLSAFGPGTSLTWNGNGTLKTLADGRQTLSFAYDAEGRLVRVDKAGTGQPGTIGYDFAGNRVFVQPIGETTKVYGISSDYEIADYGGGRRLATKYIEGLFGRAVAITAPAASAAARQALQGTNLRLGARLYQHGGRAWSGAVALCYQALAFFEEPRVGHGAGWLWLLAIALAALLAAGRLAITARFAAAGRHQRRGGAGPLVAATAYSRRRPGFAVLAPLLAACLALEVSAPALGELAPGANGAGNPTAGTVFFAQDLTSSTVSVTDDAGQETAAVGYYPFGLVDQGASRGTDNFRPKFSDQTFDYDTHLYFFGERYYDAVIGRFTTPDPAAQFINPYLLGADNPVSMVDPNGEFAFLIAVVIGAVIGAYMGAAAVNHDYNPANWDWKSGKTYAGLLGGALIGAVGGAIVEVAATAGAVAGIAGAVLVGAGENAAFTAMGGGSLKEILVSAAEGAAFGFLFGGIGAALGRLTRAAGRVTAEAAAEGSEQLEQAAARALRDSCASFLPGEQVLTAAGGSRPIERLAVGDHVQGYEQERDRSGSFPVAATLSGETREVTRVTTASGAVIESTPNHLYRAFGMGWIPADQLYPGLSLTNPEGAAVALRSVETRTLAAPRPVYNVSVDTAESYYVSASRVLVKNVRGACLLAKGIRRPGWRGSVKAAVFARQRIKSGSGKGLIESAVSYKRFARMAKVHIGKNNPRYVTIWQLDHKIPYKYLLWAADETKTVITWKNMIAISNYSANLRYLTMSENVSHAFEPVQAAGRAGAKTIFQALGLWK